jgi:hypothetical protein
VDLPDEKRREKEMRGKCGGHGLTLKRIEIKFQVQV